jgi:glutamyl-tRNA synthetase
VFDYEKARWFNHQHLQLMRAEALLALVRPYFAEASITVEDSLLLKVIDLVKERCHLLPDFVEQGRFFFQAPDEIDTASILPKWRPEHVAFFGKLAELWATADETSPEASFNELTVAQGLKKGEVMLPLRIMLVGGKWGPGVFDIVGIIGSQASASRIRHGLEKLSV